MLQDDPATSRLAQVAEVEEKVVVKEEEGNRYADFPLFPPSSY